MSPASSARIQARNYYREHREEILEKKRIRYQTNPESAFQANKQFKQRHPLRYKSIHRRYNQKRR